MRLGDLELHVLNDGDFRLDGGAMFGVVPRALWERQKPPDEQNRIRMCANCLLVEAGDDLVLVDTGLGNKLSDKLRRIYGLDESAERLPERVRSAGYELGDVTHVVQTHLHFDHCGWSTSDSGAGLAPTFPRAHYWIERREVEHARAPNERDRASYMPENWEPLFESGVVELFDDEAEPVRGVRAVRAAGHSPGMCIVLLDGGEGARGVFLADLIPTSGHVPFPWIMSFDLEPMQSLEEKKRWIPRIAAGKWLCFFEHDPERPTGRIVERSPGRFEAA